MAPEVLVRRMPSQEIAEDGNLWSFWASRALVVERNGNEDVVSTNLSLTSLVWFGGASAGESASLIAIMSTSSVF
ncbi:hypothetical protein L484_002167 [Morus notabilis]|uniref:Uncharacterized protein n=1 Tax=Morus notabilis TaxID=981085 RepID=W9S2X3_9ROSA|nr:hypothetical protein L484_002167 [Morus notabilis]